MKVTTGVFLGLAISIPFGISAQTPTPEASPYNSVSPDKAGDARLRREQAYIKLLEGQRNIWISHRLQTQAGRSNAMRLAKAAFQKAIELDPDLAEGYTALSELAVGMAPIDVDESIRLASTAVTIAPKNFGGHRMLARLYTVKSGLNNGPLNAETAEKAIEEWKKITMLDPRNAEGWAFLAAFSTAKKQTREEIEYLTKWIGSASPLDVQFYSRIMGSDAALTPESASLKLGRALLTAGRKAEAVETLSALLADDPENAEAIDMLMEAVDSADDSSAGPALEALKQAIFANPSNVSLVDTLARLESKTGRFDDAVKLLKNTVDKLLPDNGSGASSLLVSLGDLYIEKDRYSEAAAEFENALQLRGIGNTPPIADEQRSFAMHVFEKLIQAYKLADRPRDVRAVIDRARILFGKDDLFADRQLISFYRSTGNKAQALATVRSLRQRLPADGGLIHLEATLLTETGKVDDAVALIRAEMARKNIASPAETPSSEGGPDTVSLRLPLYDDFSNHLFISNLYTKANRAKEAAAAAQDAYGIALGSERKQIAKLTLATAQQTGGDYKGAEATLRELLKQTPGNPIALNNLGYFLVERDERLPEALDLIQQALKVDPRNPSYLDSLGWAYFKAGKLDEAERFIKDALRLETDSATIYEHLGDVFVKKQDERSAKAAWEKALKLASENEDIDRLKKKLAGTRIPIND